MSRAGEGGAMKLRPKSVIVYGPQGAGKTRSAPRLMRHFGLSMLLDEWMPGDEFPSRGALILTHVAPSDLPMAYSIEEALALAGQQDGEAVDVLAEAVYRMKLVPRGEMVPLQFLQLAQEWHNAFGGNS